MVRVMAKAAVIVVAESRGRCKHRLERREEVTVIDIIASAPGSKLIVGLLCTENLVPILGVSVFAQARVDHVGAKGLAVQLAVDCRALTPAVTELVLEILDCSPLVFDSLAPEGDTGSVLFALARFELVLKGS
jgi:hypothetical protein